MATRLTRHGERRVRKRTGVPKRSAARAVGRAVLHGTPREAVSGGLRRYLDILYRRSASQGKDADIIVYGNNIYLFCNKALITTWPLPERYRRMGEKRRKVYEIEEMEA